MLRLPAAILIGAYILGAQPPAGHIAIDYPAPGSVFPPDIAAPTFLWRDAAAGAKVWLIEVAFKDH